jgi:hypothetical protein
MCAPRGVVARTCAGTRVALLARMTVTDLDSWLVRTDYYLDAIDESQVEYITVHTGTARRRLWPRLVAGLALGVATFLITAYVL